MRIYAGDTSLSVVAVALRAVPPILCGVWQSCCLLCGSLDGRRRRARKHQRGRG